MISISFYIIQNGRCYPAWLDNISGVIGVDIFVNY